MKDELDIHGDDEDEVEDEGNGGEKGKKKCKGKGNAYFSVDAILPPLHCTHGHIVAGFVRCIRAGMLSYFPLILFLCSITPLYKLKEPCVPRSGNVSGSTRPSVCNAMRTWRWLPARGSKGRSIASRRGRGWKRQRWDWKRTEGCERALKKNFCFSNQYFFFFF
jgi:hypothetical protein